MESDERPEILTRAQRLLRADRVLAAAHRGYSSVAPENTLASFERAFDLGVDFIELDYHHTADGVPIVIHDSTLDRTTDASARWGRTEIAVAQRRVAEIADLDAGSWFHPSFAAAHVPTVREAIAAIAPHAVVMIERKAGDAETLVALLEEGDWIGDVVVHAFDWAFIATCKRLAPRLVTGALGRHDMTDARMDEAAATGAAFIGWANPDLSREGIGRAKSRGLRPFVFTVDDAPRAAELISWGIEGIISNAPPVIQRALTPA